MDPLATPAPPPLDTSKLTPFVDSSDLLGKPDLLRARGEQDGYLFLPGLLDPEPVLDLRRDLLRILRSHGLLAATGDELSGSLDLNAVRHVPAQDLRIDIGVSNQIYFEMTQLPSLYRITRHPALVDFYRSLFGEEILIHPRRAVRAFMPHPAQSPTPPHQDFPLVQGSAGFWTCWFPLGDCPLPQGPLAVLRGSHRSGYLPMRPRNDFLVDWKDWGVQLCDYENDWVGNDLHAGDVLTFPCFTVHQAAPMNGHPEVRLSLDVRYQGAGEALCERSLLSHAISPTTGQTATWDEIYEDWDPSDADLRYYWDPGRVQVSAFDESLIQPGARRVC